MSRSRSRVVCSTVPMVSVILLAATTPSPGNCPAEALMKRLIRNTSAASAAGLSGTSVTWVGCDRVWSSCCRPNNQFITTLSASSSSRSADHARACSAAQSAGAEFVPPHAFQIGLRPFDLTLQCVDRQRHAVHRLRPEGVDRVHGLEDVVESGLKLLHRHGGAGRLLVDLRTLDLQLLRGPLDQVP